MTTGAAYQYFQEKTMGSIEPGKRADFVLLSQEPLEVPKEALREIQVLETIQGGQKIWCRK